MTIFGGIVLGIILWLFFGGKITAVPCWQLWYWMLASIWSLFLALFAFEIHVPKIKKIKNIENNAREEEFQETEMGEWPKDNVPQVIHQLLFNFLGALAGWIIVYEYLIGHFSGAEIWVKLVLASITFLSITGYLPYIIIKTGGILSR